MIGIAWDIETCPLPRNGFSDSHRDRYEKELSREQEKNPEVDEEESSRKVRSLHPYLGWICCISVVRGEIGSGPGDPHSWTATAPDEEKALLAGFWNVVGRVQGSPRWTTFNGKQFDVPFLTARTAHHGLEPTRHDLTITHRYRDDDHADLSNVWPSSYGLEDMCDHLGVESPKDGMDGSDVAPTVADGRIEEVREYGERDAIATFRCLEAVHWAL